MKGEALIKQERYEQIHKHGFSLQRDWESYQEGELVQAALFCEEQAEIEKGDHENQKYPEFWNKHFENKIREKTKIQKYTVAGAFYLAEYERTGDSIYQRKAKAIARKINKLL